MKFVCLAVWTTDRNPRSSLPSGLFPTMVLLLWLVATWWLSSSFIQTVWPSPHRHRQHSESRWLQGKEGGRMQMGWHHRGDGGEWQRSGCTDRCSLLFLLPLPHTQHLPLLIIVIAITLACFSVVSFTFPWLAVTGTFTAWIYLRFYQKKEQDTRGDMAESFAFATFFPEPIQ